MAIEIKELSIKVQVNNSVNKRDKENKQSTAIVDEERIVQKCIKNVLSILEEKDER
jgi:hypothetical protein